MPPKLRKLIDQLNLLVNKKCPLCPKRRRTFKTENELGEHIKRIHPECFMDMDKQTHPILTNEEIVRNVKNNPVYYRNLSKLGKSSRYHKRTRQEMRRDA